MERVGGKNKKARNRKEKRCETESQQDEEKQIRKEEVWMSLTMRYIQLQDPPPLTTVTSHPYTPAAAKPGVGDLRSHASPSQAGAIFV